jgi:hypothetical protein
MTEVRRFAGFETAVTHPNRQWPANSNQLVSCSGTSMNRQAQAAQASSMRFSPHVAKGWLADRHGVDSCHQQEGAEQLPVVRQ